MLKILVITIAAVAAFIAISMSSETVSAAVQECFTGTPTTFTQGNDSNDLDAMTFIASGSYSIGAVKLNIYRIGIDSTVRIFITQTSGVPPNAAPDMNNVLGSEAVNTSGLPEMSGVNASDNAFSCDPLVDVGQYVVFDPPVAITGGTQYGLVVEYDSGTTSTTIFGYVWDATPNSSPYPDGQGFECNVPTSCSRTIPGDWDPTNAQGRDKGFAVFDNLITIVPAGTADTWLENFLTDFLGLNSATGKLIYGLGFILLMLVGMLFLRVHMLVVMGFGGFATATAVLALLVPAELFLAMFAILGVGMLVGGIALKGVTTE